MRHLAWVALVPLLVALASCAASVDAPAASGPDVESSGEGADPSSAREQRGEQLPAPSNESAADNSTAPAGSLDGVGAAPPAASAGATDLAPAPPLPPGTKVLHIGDSFAGALGLPLGKLLENGGVRSVLQHTDSSYLTDWAWDGKLQQYLYKYNPDLVIITLGANELAIAEPEQREKTVRKIVATIGDRPCVWVAIPLWSDEHNGLLEVIRASSAPCVYYDTNRLFDARRMPRIHDGIHPTKDARRAWAESFFGWLTEHRDRRAKEPLRMLP